jgi:hypothetical protein
MELPMDISVQSSKRCWRRALGTFNECNIAIGLVFQIPLEVLIILVVRLNPPLIYTLLVGRAQGVSLKDSPLYTGRV